MFNAKRTLLCHYLLLLTICELCVCAPQAGYYNYNYNYNYPYYNARRAAYPYANSAYATYQRQRAAATNRLPIRSNSIRRPLGTSADYTSASSSAVAANVAAVGSRTPKRQNDDAEKYRVSKADAENAKFAGAGNQEAEDEDTKTLMLLQRKRRNRFRPYANRCSLFGRDAASETAQRSTTPPPKEQGRFLWDINVYNVYPNGGLYADAPQYPTYADSYGCGGLLGGGGGLLGGGGGLLGGGGGLLGGGGGLLGGGGGLLSDPTAPATPPLNNFLNLFAPGILQNALAATARPRPQRPALTQTDPIDNELNDLQNDAAVDPNYAAPAPVRRPNRVYFDSAGASPITPAQLVGGVATTVNGIIQQLTGNIQPVYQSYYRSARYGK